MFDNYVLKIRRDFSSVLIPSSVFAQNIGKKKSKPERTLFNISHLAAHAAGCDCSCCLAHDIADLDDGINKVAYNDSENGYIISSRSKQAIKNAANSIFFRTDHKEYLRFITFTFPPIPVKHDTKVQEDKYLHSLFKKFLDNERKHYGLKRWLWTNERQSGERLQEHEKSAREVLHYHCIFEYEDRINYYFVNLRFLRLLHRNGFDILSSHSKAVKKASLEYPKLKVACQAIAKGDYDYLVQDTERMYFRDNLGIKRFMFLSPVDFERIRYSALDIGKISAYISKYVSKSGDKVYCRRWGASKGLVISDSRLKEFVEENFFEEYIDYDTGEVIMIVSKKLLFNFLIMNDPTTKLFRFQVEINNKIEEIIYIPPNWQKWRHHSGIAGMFKKYFEYEI